MSRRVPVVLSLLIASSIHAAVIVLPEHEVGPVTSDAVATFPVHDAAVATDGSGYLVAWPQGARVFVVPVLPSGEPLEARTLPFAGSAHNVSVCWTGTMYLVAWGADDGLTVAAVTASGFPLSPARKVAGDVATGASPLASASNGDHTMLLYSWAGRVQAALFDSSGATLCNDIALFDDNATDAVTVATDGTSFFVIRTHPSAVYPQTIVQAMRLSASGDIELPPTDIAADLGRTTGLDAVFTGSNFIFVFASFKNFGAPAIRRFVLTSHLATRELPAIADDADVPPKVILRNREVLVYHGAAGPTPGSRALQLYRFTEAAPEPVGARFGATLNSIISSVALVSGGRLFGVSGLDAFVVDEARPGAALQTIELTAFPRVKSAPLVAAIGDQSLVVWAEPSRVFARRVGHDGEPLDAVPAFLGWAANMPAPAVSVVAAGDLYWVVWSRYENGTVTVMAQGIRTDGSWIAPQPIDVPGVGPGRVVANGSEIAIFAANTMARFALDGTFIGTSRLTGVPSSPAVIASNGGGFLFVYDNETFTGCSRWGCALSSERLTAIRINASGEALDAQPFEIAPLVTSQEGLYGSLHVASHGGDYLVAYTRNGDVFAQRVSGGANVSAPVRVDGNARLATVTGAPDGYLLMTSVANGFSVVRTNDDGRLVDRFNGTFDGTAGALAMRSDGVAVAAYQRTVDEFGGAPAEFVRLIGLYDGSRFRTVRH